MASLVRLSAEQQELAERARRFVNGIAGYLCGRRVPRDRRRRGWRRGSGA